MVVILSHWNALHLFVSDLERWNPYPSSHPQKKRPSTPDRSNRSNGPTNPRPRTCNNGSNRVLHRRLTSPPSKKSRSKSLGAKNGDLSIGRKKTRGEPFRVGSRCDKMIPIWILSAKAPEKLPGPKKESNLPTSLFFKGELLNFRGVWGDVLWLVRLIVSADGGNIAVFCSLHEL